MVEAQIKQNTFWFWSNVIDFQKIGDVAYWLPSHSITTNLSHKLSEVAKLSDLKFSPSENQNSEFSYIDISNINTSDGSYEKTKIKNAYAPSRARKKLERFNIIVSTVRPNRNATSIILEDADDLVCSTGFAVLKATKINPYYLFVFTKTSYFIEQLVRQTSATMYPAVNEKDVLNVGLFIPSEKDQQKVEQITKDAFLLNKEAEEEHQEAIATFLDSIKTYISEWDTLTTQTRKTFWLWSDQVNITNRIDPDYYSGEGIKNKLGKVKPLGDLAEIKIGKTPAFDDYLPSGKRRIMKFRAITGSGIDLENEERGFVKEEFFQKNKQNKLNENDVVLGSAAHQAHYIGKYLDIVDKLPKEFEDGVLAVAEIMTIRAKEAINPFVLLMFLRSSVGYEMIQKQIKGQTSHLYPKDVAGIGIPEAIIKISKSETGKKIESKIRSSLEKSRLSKQKLQEAKNFVENLIAKK